MAFDIKVITPDDTGVTNVHADLTDSTLCKRIRLFNKNMEFQIRRPDDFVVQLRLSLMKTLVDTRGILDLPFIDSVIRQVIRNFRNKYQMPIQQSHWAILTNMCWDEIKHNEREEQEEIEPIDLSEDDIDNWLNSEFQE